MLLTNNVPEISRVDNANERDLCHILTSVYLWWNFSPKIQINNSQKFQGKIKLNVLVQHTPSIRASSHLERPSFDMRKRIEKRSIMSKLTWPLSNLPNYCSFMRASDHAKFSVELYYTSMNWKFDFCIQWISQTSCIVGGTEVVTGCHHGARSVESRANWTRTNGLLYLRRKLFKLYFILMKNNHHQTQSFICT